jgi:hypothetical protein
MTTYPQDSGLVTDLLGVASSGKQIFTRASWLILFAAAMMAVIRFGRGRDLRRTHRPFIAAGTAYRNEARIDGQSASTATGSGRRRPGSDRSRHPPAGCVSRCAGRGS